MIRKLNSPISEDAIFKINFWLIVTSITLLRLPIAFGYRTDISYLYLGVIPYIWGIIINYQYLKKHKNPFLVKKKYLFLVCIFLLLWIIAFFRTGLIGNSIESIFILGQLFTFLICEIFIFLAFRICTNKDHINKFKKAIIYGFGMYVTTNLIFLVLEIIPPNTIYLIDYPAQILSLFGIKANRVLFPMVSGINYYGSLVGVTFIGLVLSLNRRMKFSEKMIIGLMTLACGISLVMADSRGAIAFTFLILLIAFLHGRLFSITCWVPFVISIVTVLAFSFIPGFLEDPISTLNRPDSEVNLQDNEGSKANCDLVEDTANGVLSNRPIIWNAGFNELSSFKLIHLIGFGFRGQISSGISERYSCFFISQTKNNLASLHNVWLQTIIDIGYIGAIFTFILLITFINAIRGKLSTDYDQLDYAILCMVLLIISVGALEASIQPDFYELFLLFNFLLISQLFKIQLQPERFLDNK